jgi:hypothetical protein
MGTYGIFLRIEAVDSFKAVRGIQRQQISLFIDSLANDPNRSGDFAERDDSGRQIEIKVLGEFAITYWTDHAVREVKVLDIRKADKA